MAKEKVTKKLSVIERRLQNATPFESGSIELPAKEPGKWQFRIFNSQASTNRAWMVINRLGWEYATPDDLAASPEDLGLSVRDGKLVMGQRGEEFIGKMPLKDWKELQKQKSAYNLRHTYGAKHVKSAVVEKASAEHGPEAADFLNRSLKDLEITDTRGPATDVA